MVHGMLLKRGEYSAEIHLSEPVMPSPNVQNHKLLGRNVTLAYDTLDVTLIDTNRIRDEIGPEGNMLVLGSEAITYMNAPMGLNVQIGGRRVSVTSQSPSADHAPVWETATKLHSLVGPKSQLVAFGFNYDLELHGSAEDLRASVRASLFGDLSKLEASLAGNVVSASPSVVLMREDSMYTLALELAIEQPKAHVNVHFESKGKGLPSTSQLRERFLRELEQVSQALALIEK
jgi:hypothetical protein